MVSSEILKEIRLFRGLSQKEIDLVADVATEWECAKGQFIFKEGDQSEVIYVIRKGEVAAQISEGFLVNHTVATLGSGEAFGELAFIDRQPRTATIRCTKPSILISITRDDFRRLGKANANIQRVMYKNIALFLAERLRSSNEKLKELVGRNKDLIGLLPRQFVV